MQFTRNIRNFGIERRFVNPKCSVFRYRVPKVESKPLFETLPGSAGTTKGGGRLTAPSASEKFLLQQLENELLLLVGLGQS